MKVKASSRFGTVTEDKRSVTTLLETHRTATGKLVANGRIESNTFPLEQSSTTEYYMQAAVASDHEARRHRGRLGLVRVGHPPPGVLVPGGAQLRSAVHHGRPGRTSCAARPRRCARTPRSSDLSPPRCTSARSPPTPSSSCS